MWPLGTNKDLSTSLFMFQINLKRFTIANWVQNIESDFAFLSDLTIFTSQKNINEISDQ